MQNASIQHCDTNRSLKEIHQQILPHYKGFKLLDGEISKILKNIAQHIKTDPEVIDCQEKAIAVVTTRIKSCYTNHALSFEERVQKVNAEYQNFLDFHQYMRRALEIKFQTDKKTHDFARCAVSNIFSAVKDTYIQFSTGAKNIETCKLYFQSLLSIIRNLVQDKQKKIRFTFFAKGGFEDFFRKTDILIRGEPIPSETPPRRVLEADSIPFHRIWR